MQPKSCGVLTWSWRAQVTWHILRRNYVTAKGNFDGRPGPKHLSSPCHLTHLKRNPMEDLDPDFRPSAVTWLICQRYSDGIPGPKLWPSPVFVTHKSQEENPSWKRPQPKVLVSPSPWLIVPYWPTSQMNPDGVLTSPNHVIHMPSEF